MSEEPLIDRLSEPAFPQPCTHNGHAANSCYQVAGGGMSLRDYFAGRAIGSLILLESNCEFRELALDAYSLADAMLEVRKKGSE